MTEELRLECLRIAAMRNQKLSASPGDIVAEAKCYEDFLAETAKKSLTKANHRSK